MEEWAAHVHLFRHCFLFLPVPHCCCCCCWEADCIQLICIHEFCSCYCSWSKESNMVNACRWWYLSRNDAGHFARWVFTALASFDLIRAGILLMATQIGIRPNWLWKMFILFSSKRRTYYSVDWDNNGIFKRISRNEYCSFCWRIFLFWERHTYLARNIILIRIPWYQHSNSIWS